MLTCVTWTNAHSTNSVFCSVWTSDCHKSKLLNQLLNHIFFMFFSFKHYVNIYYYWNVCQHQWSVTWYVRHILDFLPDKQFFVLERVCREWQKRVLKELEQKKTLKRLDDQGNEDKEQEQDDQNE